MNFWQNMLNFTPLTFLKIFVLLFEFFYIGFAFILLRQERLMSETVEIPASSFFRLLVYANFIAGMIVFILSLFIL